MGSTKFSSLSEWLDTNSHKLDALVFDIDGVLRAGQELLPGAADLLARLRETRVPFTFLTNDGTNSHNQKAASLTKSGLIAYPDEIVSATDGLIKVVEEKGLAGSEFFVMGKLGDPCYGKAAGLKITTDVKKLKHCQGIIISEDRYSWELALNATANFLAANPAAPLIVPNPDEFFPWKKGRFLIGSGALARFLQGLLKNMEVDIEPIYLGKPHEPIFQINHARLEESMGRKADIDRVLMVGDFLESDIRGANRFGYRSALMMTGMTTSDMLEISEVKPDLVFEAL